MRLASKLQDCDPVKKSYSAMYLPSHSLPSFIALVVLLTCYSQNASKAATTIYSSDFSQSSGANSVAGWTRGGISGEAPSRSATAWDNFAISSGVYGGDGVKGDGSLYLNTVDGVQGNEHWTYTLEPTMNVGDVINLVGSTFNAFSSHNISYTFGLYNVTDDRFMVTSGTLGGTRLGADESTDINPFYNFDLTYVAQEEDAGDVFQIRVVENLNNAARNINVDHVAVTVVAAVPEPSRWMLLMVAAVSMMMHRRRSACQFIKQ
jgi:hypothetical protein